MAASCTGYSLCHKPPLVEKDEFAGRVFTEGSSTFTPTLALFYTFFPVLAFTLAFALSPTTKLFKQFMQSYIKKLKTRLFLWY